MPVENIALNAIRSIAALLVVLNHVRALCFVDYSKANSRGILTQVVYGLSNLAHSAVMVFFVMSGFWVGGSVVRQLRSGRFEPLSYSVARLTRLWIVLIPALVLTAGLDIAGARFKGDSLIYAGSSIYNSVVPVDLATHHGFLAWTGNVGFMQTLYVPTFGTNSALWSLAYEFWYYAIFPLVAIAVLASGRRALRLIALLTAVLIAFIVGTKVLLLFPVWLLGVFAALTLGHVRIIMPKLQRILAVAALSGTVVIVSLAELGDPWGEYLVGISTTYFVIVYAQTDQPTMPWSPVTIAAWYAHSSYSLYATHLPVLAFVVALLGPPGAERWQVGVQTVVNASGFVVLALLVAWLFSLMTERRTELVRSVITRFLARQLDHDFARLV